MLTAKRAIEILKQLEDAHGSELLAYWVAPNVVLTLCGARSYCDGVLWDDEGKGLQPIWVKEVSSMFPTLSKATELIYSQAGVNQGVSSEQYAGYEIATVEGLQHTLQQTKLISSMQKIDFKSKDEVELVTSLQVNFNRRNSTIKNLPQCHNDIAFGVLLGYPDLAIISYIEEDAKERTPFSEPYISADIRGADYYVCPQPVYSYPRHLISDPVIQRHEKGWSQILEDYYTSDFHKKLEKHSGFKRKIKELGFCE
jgi:hypothetical protein